MDLALGDEIFGAPPDGRNEQRLSRDGVVEGQRTVRGPDRLLEFGAREVAPILGEVPVVTAYAIGHLLRYPVAKVVLDGELRRAVRLVGHYGVGSVHDPSPDLGAADVVDRRRGRGREGRGGRRDAEGAQECASALSPLFFGGRVQRRGRGSRVRGTSVNGEGRALDGGKRDRERAGG